MNKIYRVIWSKTKNCYVVVSEYAKRSGKCSSSLNKKLLAAFLIAGTVLSVTGNAWAATTVGWSVNGLNNTVDDDYQTLLHESVWGTGNTVSASLGTAWGQSNIVSASWGTAWGYGNTVIGSNTEDGTGVPVGTYATAWGDGNTVNTTASTAFGHATKAGEGNVVYNAYIKDWWTEEKSGKGNYATAFGKQTQALGEVATAFGEYTVANGDQATAFGHGTVAEGLSSVAFGQLTRATGPQSTAFGNASKAAGINATAFGMSTIASNDAATAFGTNTKASENYSTAFGQYTEASGLAATAWGYGLPSNKVVASGIASTAFGRQTKAGRQLYEGKEANIQSYIDESAPSYNNTRYKIVDKDGNTLKDSFQTYANALNAMTRKDYATAWGYKTDAAGNASTAFGRETTAEGDYSITFGYLSAASANFSTAFGRSTKATATGATAFGNGTVASGDYSTAFGVESKAYGENSLAALGGTVGEEPEGDAASAGKASVAIGEGAQVFTDYTYAIGQNALATKDATDAIVFGNNASVSVADSVAIGTSASVELQDKKSVALGSYSKADKLGGYKSPGTDDVEIGSLKLSSSDFAGVGDDVVGTVSIGYVPAQRKARAATGEVMTRTLTYVGAGEISATSTDAINGSQLYYAMDAAQFDIVAGDNIEVIKSTDDNGHTVYTVHSLNAIVEAGENIEVKEDTPDETTTSNGSTTVADGGKAGATPTASENPIKPDKENNHTTTYTVSATGGGGIAEISFNGDNKDAQIDSPKVLNIEGGATGNLTDGNIGVESDGKDTLTIRLAKDIKDVDTIEVNKTITVGGDTTFNSDGLTIKDGPSVTKDGIDAGGKKITNVAPGTDDTDAVNVSQLRDASGDIYNSINRVDNRMKKGLAGAAALAALHPLEFDPDDKLTFAAGLGNYRGENAGAVGAFYRPDEKVMLSVGGTFGNGENMVNAGISFSLDRVAHVTNSKTAMAREILDLRRELTELKASMASGNWMLDPSLTRLFPDTEENHWAYEYVKTLAGNHIIEGYPDGLFKGERMITRYEMAAILYRAMMSGANLPDKALNEFAAELGRFRVDRVYGKGDARHKVERIRVNDENRKERDVYGSEYDYFKKNPGANISTGALPGTKQAERAAKAAAAAKQSEKPSIVSETKAAD